MDFLKVIWDLQYSVCKTESYDSENRNFNECDETAILTKTKNVIFKVKSKV